MRVLVAILVVPLAGAASAQDPATAPPGALACSGCHGAGSEMALDGWRASEIAAAMVAYRDGSREGTLMGRLAAGFSDDEIAGIAAWIAGGGAE